VGSLWNTSKHSSTPRKVTNILQASYGDVWFPKQRLEQLGEVTSRHPGTSQGFLRREGRDACYTYTTHLHTATLEETFQQR